MKYNILVYGAGAIGRGYLPWVFSPGEYEYSYVEANPMLVKMLQQRKEFTTYQTKNNSYKALRVFIKNCYQVGQEKEALKNADLIVIAVGPRNIPLLAEHLKEATAPIVLAENDPETVEMVKSVTGSNKVFFAIPDVIASNTAPENLLKKDPLAVTTEDGVCYIDKSLSHFKSNANYVSKEELDKQWKAKLYLHNTPHCIAAYLGAQLSVQYVHQSMKNKKVYQIVQGAMKEMQQVLIKKFKLPTTFVNWYAQKELKRFSNELLYDPINRVAREPFRKLAPGGRLIGAAQLCLSSGVMPENITKGIIAAFHYKNKNDPDAHISLLVHSLTPGDFLSIILGLKEGSALYELLLEQKLSYNSLLKKIS